MALTNSAVAFINSSGQLSSNSSNLYVQKGVNTIQSALNAVVDYSYSSIQLSSGIFSENIILSKTIYTLSGVQTRLSGNMLFGVASIKTQDISVNNIDVLGSLTFLTDTTHYLGHYFANCVFQGAITFPTTSVSGSNGITFEDCSFICV